MTCKTVTYSFDSCKVSYLWRQNSAIIIGITVSIRIKHLGDKTLVAKYLKSDAP